MKPIPGVLQCFLLNGKFYLLGQCSEHMWAYQVKAVNWNLFASDIGGLGGRGSMVDRVMMELAALG